MTRICDFRLLLLLQFHFQVGLKCQRGAVDGVVGRRERGKGGWD